MYSHLKKLSCARIIILFFSLSLFLSSVFTRSGITTMTGGYETSCPALDSARFLCQTPGFPCFSSYSPFRKRAPCKVAEQMEKIERAICSREAFNFLDTTPPWHLFRKLPTDISFSSSPFCREENIPVRTLKISRGRKNLRIFMNLWISNQFIFKTRLIITFLE